MIARRLASTWTATTRVRVELEDIGGRTKMLMTHVGVPGDSAGLGDGTRQAGCPRQVTQRRIAGKFG
jgi:hypothetical protein